MSGCIDTEHGPIPYISRYLPRYLKVPETSSKGRGKRGLSRQASRKETISSRTIPVPTCISGLTEMRLLTRWSHWSYFGWLPVRRFCSLIGR